MTKLLEGIVEDVDDPRITTLETEVRTLKRELSDAKVEATRAREDADRALSMLRRQLSPLYRALQGVFGELDAAGVADDVPLTSGTTMPASTSSGDPRVAAVWAAWKQKLGPAAARIIDALLLHGEMNTTQLAIVAQMHRTNVPKAIFKLNQAGLVNKNAGRFSLKQL